MTNDYIINKNPDFMTRKMIEEKIKNNDGFCVSALKQSEDTKCICKEFKEQKHTGWCHCGLYYKILKTPKVCLCGSARFRDKFFEIAKELTLQGYSVIIPILFVKEDIDSLTPIERERFNEIHKAKVADADLIYVINQDDYIGETTRDVINWAVSLGKKIKYLED